MTTFGAISTATNVDSSLRARWEILNSAQGLLTETFSTRFMNSNQLLVSQTVYGELVGLIHGEVISSLTTYVITAGSSLTLVKVGLYSKTGTLLASSADNKANFTSNQVYVTTSFSSSYTVTASDGYYLALLAVGTTPPTMLAPNFSNQAIVGTTATAGNKPLCVVQASQSDLPSPATFGGSSSKPIWMACS